MRLLLMLIAILYFVACNKDSNDPPDNASLSYKINDTLITIKASANDLLMTKARINGKTLYTFSGAEKINSAIEGFTFSAITDSLQTGTYVFDSLWMQHANDLTVLPFIILAITHDSFSFIPTGENDKGKFTLIISSYDNGLISGSFSGMLGRIVLIIPGSGIIYSYASITEGEFKNVKVIY